MTAKDNRKWTLYVLRLEGGKWYVGITSQPVEKRLQEHLGGRKSYWTEKYPPIEVADVKSLGDLNLEEAKAYENKVTRAYIKEKGVNSVRGGDLMQKEDYIIRFGYIWDKLTWESLAVIILQTLLLIYCLIDKYYL